MLKNVLILVLLAISGFSGYFLLTQVPAKLLRSDTISEVSPNGKYVASVSEVNELNHRGDYINFTRTEFCIHANDTHRKIVTLESNQADSFFQCIRNGKKEGIINWDENSERVTFSLDDRSITLAIPEDPVK